MAMEAPARLSLTNDAPLTAAPAIAARPVAEAAIASLCRDWMARVSTVTAATSRSVPRAAWPARVAGGLVSPRPRAVPGPCPWSAAGTWTYRLTPTPRITWAMSITQMPELVPRSPARRRARWSASGCCAVPCPAAAWLIAGSVLCMAGLPPGSRSGEQVADRGGQDADRVVLVDLAGPDLVRAGVHQGDGRCHQPAGWQVGTEGPVCLPAFGQRADGVVRGLVGPGERLGAEQLGHRRGHRLVPRQVLPGRGEHPV